MKIKFFAPALLFTLLIGVYLIMNVRGGDEAVLPTEIKDYPDQLESFSVERAGENDKIVVTNAEKLNELREFFSDFAVREKLVKILFQYKLTLNFSKETHVFRVTETGLVLLDIPASSIQNGYESKKEGLARFLENIYLN